MSDGWVWNHNIINTMSPKLANYYQALDGSKQVKRIILYLTIRITVLLTNKRRSEQ